MFYKKEILEQFYAGLCTNQLVVLSGQPGTGKTSLVEGFCDAVGAKLKVISVQPNWTDNQDLIGFYNPIENTYVPTSFLDAVIEAKENPEVLHVICLDEMNLAYVEYYFSEFLSKMQSEKRAINLYSDYVFKQASREIAEKIKFYTESESADDSNVEINIEKIKHKDINEYYKLKRQWDSIRRYPANLDIPSNLRFVGTINKDETTKDFSPKVIDRSYIMEINSYNLSSFSNIEKMKHPENLYIKAEEFKEKNAGISEELSKKLNELGKGLIKINVQFINNRIISQIQQICGAGIIKENDIFDVIAATKILPKINTDVDDDSILEEIADKLNGTEFSKNIFENMKKYCIESGTLTFWR